MIYLDTSVALAQLLAEDRHPPESLWQQPLVSSRLLEYETWNRIHALRLGRSHGEALRQLLASVALLELAPAGAERHDVGRGDGSSHTIGRERVAELLESLGRRHDVVVRLKGGDPFVFGFAGEELLHLQRAGVRWEIVPGVTSAIAAPAAAGIPVTHRRVARSVTFFGDHPDPDGAGEATDWAALARVPGTLVSLMGVGRLADIAAWPVAVVRPASTPAAVVRWGSTPPPQVLTGTLADIAERAGGAGLQDYVGPDARGVTGGGGSWEARVTFGTRRVVAAELEYLGSAGTIEALGLDSDAVLVSNGGEATLRVNVLPEQEIQPYILAGFGLQHYYLANESFNTSSVTGADDVLNFPVGLGVAYQYDGLVLDLRAVLRPVTDSEMLGTAAPMHSMGGTLRLGWEF